MTWKVFAGAYGDVYLALLRHRCLIDGDEPTDEHVAHTLNIHLHRGIGHLAGRRDIHTIGDLLAIAV